MLGARAALVTDRDLVESQKTKLIQATRRHTFDLVGCDSRFHEVCSSTYSRVIVIV